MKHSACPWEQWSWWWGSQSPALLELALRGVWDGRAEPVSTRGSLLEQWPELCRRSTAPPLDRCKSLIPIISCKIWKVYNQTWTMCYVLCALATKSFRKKSANLRETTGIILDSVALCFHQVELLDTQSVHMKYIYTVDTYLLLSSPWKKVPTFHAPVTTFPTGTIGRRKWGKKHRISTIAFSSPFPILGAKQWNHMEAFGC